jgi:hypothetical protein
VVSAIQKIAGTFKADTVQLLSGIVTAVNGNVCNVDAVSGNTSTPLTNVQFQAAVGDGIDAEPSIGSQVYVLLSKYNNPVIVSYSDIENLYIAAATLIQFNDGSFGGLVKVIELTQKLNNLENKVNDVISKFNTHVHSGVQTGGGTSAVPTSIVSGNLTPTNRNDIENTVITHGS